MNQRVFHDLSLSQAAGEHLAAPQIMRDLREATLAIPLRFASGTQGGTREFAGTAAESGRFAPRFALDGADLLSWKARLGGARAPPLEVVRQTRHQEFAYLTEVMMALRVEVSEMINRPVSEVFDFYAHNHIQNHPRWDPDMHLEKVSDGPVGLGTVIRRRNTHSGTPVEGIMEVVEFEPDRVFAVKIQDGSTETYGRVTFEHQSGDVTRITIAADFMDLDESMREFMTGLMGRSTRNIKSLIESEY